MNEAASVLEVEFNVLLISPAASITITAEILVPAKEFVTIHYVQTDNEMCFTANGHNNYSYSIGEPKGMIKVCQIAGTDFWVSGASGEAKWLQFSRNVYVDVYRAYADSVNHLKRTKRSRPKLAASNVRLVTLAVRGKLAIKGWRMFNLKFAVKISLHLL